MLDYLHEMDGANLDLKLTPFRIRFKWASYAFDNKFNDDRMNVWALFYYIGELMALVDHPIYIALII